MWRRDARRHRLTVVMTAQGARAIGLDSEAVVVPDLGSVADAERTGGNSDDQDANRAGDPGDCGAGCSATVLVTPAAAAPGSKLGLVVSALSSDEGATLAALVTLTGWLPHTTRAALCRLRQRGYSIRLVGDAGNRTYRLDTPAQG